MVGGIEEVRFEGALVVGGRGRRGWGGGAEGRVGWCRAAGWPGGETGG